MAMESERGWDGEVFMKYSGQNLEMKETRIISVSGLDMQMHSDAVKWNADTGSENEYKTLSKIIALHCKCNILILKSYFADLVFKVMVIHSIDYTDVEKPLGITKLVLL